jgi:hypothetical protein
VHFGSYGDVPLGSVDDPLDAQQADAAGHADPLSAPSAPPADAAGEGATAADVTAAAAAPGTAVASLLYQHQEPPPPATAQAPPPPLQRQQQQQQQQQQQRAPDAKAPGLYPEVPKPAAALRPPAPAPQPLGSAELRISVHSPTTLRGPTGVPGAPPSPYGPEAAPAEGRPAPLKTGQLAAPLIRHPCT